MRMISPIEEYARRSIESVRTKEDLDRIRLEITKKFNLPKVISNTDISSLIGDDLGEKHKHLLVKKPTRTISGVSVIAIMTSPYSCPHGRCTYCPGGVEFASPQAYTGFEPAAMRGKQNNYDSFLETENRLRQLRRIGHPTDKIDLIVMGGTFTARTEEYQRNFVKGSLDAMNGFISKDLASAILENETSENRCIGLTVETRPDWFYEKEIDLALSYGATKVELGVQTTFNDIHRATRRAHRISDVIRSTRYAKDSGFKVLYHLMPGIGGVDMKGDMAALRRIFSDENLRPDMLKIYPSLVVKGTDYYKQFRNGEYRSYESDEAVEVVSEFFRHIPNYVRVHRIQRDIPVFKIVQGVKRSDLHDLAIRKAEEKGYQIQEIRYREIRDGIEKDVEFRMTSYYSSGGFERFLEFVNGDNRIIAFLRLRIPGDSLTRQELLGKTVVREIKTFGREARIDERGEYQHRGYGRRLLGQAEEITREEGYRGIAVISGIGVREYFRKNGYERSGTYMVKRVV